MTVIPAFSSTSIVKSRKEAEVNSSTISISNPSLRRGAKKRSALIYCELFTRNPYLPAMYLTPSNLYRQDPLIRLTLYDCAKLGKCLQQVTIWTATKRLRIGSGKGDSFRR